MSTAPVDLVCITEQIADVIRTREAELRLEQAVHGLDHAAEVGLQALVAAGLAAQHRVTREAYYPSSEGKRSHRPRCDLVLTPRGLPLETEAASDTPTCRAEDALWLELKVAHQLRPSGRSHPRYGQQWRRALVADLQKMRLDPKIEHAALGLVVFTDSLTTLAKDLLLFEALAGETGLFGFRTERSVPITERIGHHVCSVVVWPLA